jgi:hypothetical protein
MCCNLQSAAVCNPPGFLSKLKNHNLQSAICSVFNILLLAFANCPVQKRFKSQYARDFSPDTASHL